MIKTVNLTADTEEKVTGLEYAHARVTNNTTGILYASKHSGVVAGGDDVLAIPAGTGDYVKNAGGTVYLLSSAGGSVQLEGDGVNETSYRPFARAASGGGGGETTDSVARAAIEAHAGNNAIHVTAAQKAAWSAVSGENLLDNPDFRINQRGQTEYAAAGYTVDRWNINIGKVEPAANGIAITNNDTGIMRLRQNTEFGYAQIAGKPLSVSVRAGGTTYSATANVPAEKPTTAFTELVGVEIADGVSFVCNYSLADDMIFAYFGLTAGDSLSPEWVKLEVGAVTPYVPPNPADALARCQRYYQIRSTNDIAAVDLRPTMRTTPTDIAAVEGGYAYVAEL